MEWIHLAYLKIQLPWYSKCFWTFCLLFLWGRYLIDFQGYNRLVVFSRPFYFSLCCGLLLLLDYAIPYCPSKPISVYGLPFGSVESLTFARDLLTSKFYRNTMKQLKFVGANYFEFIFVNRYIILIIHWGCNFRDEKNQWNSQKLIHHKF